MSTIFKFKYFRHLYMLLSIVLSSGFYKLHCFDNNICDKSSYKSLYLDSNFGSFLKKNCIITYLITRITQKIVKLKMFMSFFFYIKSFLE